MTSNYGLSGQQDLYDFYGGIGKNARQKKNENRAIRVEKRRLKNDERKADVERSKAEAQLIQQMTQSQPDTAGANKDIDPQDKPPGTWWIAAMAVATVVLGVVLFFITRPPKPPAPPVTKP